MSHKGRGENMKSNCSAIVLMILALTLLTGCFGGGGGGGGSSSETSIVKAYSCYSSLKVSDGQVTGTFCDGAITNGSQVSQVQRSFLKAT